MPKPLLLPASPPLRQLRAALPFWAFGLEGPWLGRHLGTQLAALAATQPKWAGLATALAVWNFERVPLDPVFAADALAASRTAGDGAGRRAFLGALAKRLRPPAGEDRWPRVRDAPDAQAGCAFLRAAMDGAGPSLFWHGRAFAFALARSLPDFARDVAGRLRADAAMAPLGARLAAEIAFAWEGPRAGLAALAAVDAALFPAFTALAQAYGLEATGQADAALPILTRLWRKHNWHPGLTLRLHALLHPLVPCDLDALPGRLFVFLYTWNRAGLLATTLDSLAASRLGPARVVVLNNGGTDDTAQVCRTAADRFGPDRLMTIRLPVNVGAPAGRNWLAASSNVGPGDLAAYVDDDVTLPAHWLETLVAALLADPLADVAGARIVAAAPGAARVAQAADVRLLPPDAGHVVRPLVNYGPGPDLGLLATVRPCASVSGCCHVFRGAALAGGAPFDIRFSPSQFDDLARDLHGFLAGRRAVYAGDVAVAHQQHAGPGQAKTAAAIGQLLGARTKLDGLFAPSVMQVAADRDLDTAWEELEAKWAQVREDAASRLAGD